MGFKIIKISIKLVFFVSGCDLYVYIKVIIFSKNFFRIKRWFFLLFFLMNENKLNLCGW